MNNLRNTHFENKSIYISKLCAIAVLVIAFLVTIGWIFNIELFKRVLPHLISMKINTIICFIFLAVGILCLLSHIKSVNNLSFYFAFIPFIIGSITLGQYLTGIDIGIDRYFAQDVNAISQYPGRMAQPSAINFVLLSISIFIFQKDYYKYIGQLLAIIVFFLTIGIAITYIYKIQQPVELYDKTNMAIPTVVEFFLSSIAILTARPQEGFLKTFLSPTSGGVMLRRLLPWAFFLPIPLSWIYLMGSTYLNLYSISISAILMVISNILIFVILIYVDCNELTKTDEKRIEAEEHLSTQLLLSKISSEITSLKEFIPIFLQTIGEKLRWPIGIVWLFDKETNLLKCHTFWAATNVKAPQLEEKSKEKALEPGFGLVGRVYNSKIPKWVSNFSEETTYTRKNDALADGLKSAVLFPLKSETQILGVAEFYSFEERPQNQQMLDLLNMIGNQSGTFILRRQAEDALSNLAAIVENSQDAIYQVSTKGKIVTWNSGAEKMYGYSSKEIIGRDIDILLKENNIHHKIFSSLENNTPVINFESQRRTKNGDIFFTSLTASQTASLDKDGSAFSFIEKNISLKKNWEEYLRKTEERFNLVNKATSDIIWDWDLSTNEIWFNENIEIFGYSLENRVVNYNWWFEKIHPEDQARVSTSRHLVIDSNSHIWSKEYRFRRRNGSYAHVNDRSYVIHGKNGPNDVRMIGAMVDITNRKLTENAINESQKELEAANSRLKGILESTKDMIGALNLEFQLIAYNQAFKEEFAKIFGSKIEIGMTLAECLGNGNPEDEKIALSIWEKALHGDDFTTIVTFTGQKNEKNIYEIAFTSIKNNQDERIGFTNVIRNVTERIKAEKALKQSEEKFRSFIETTKEWIWAMDVKGVINYSNPAVFTILGIDPVEILNTHFIDLLHPDDKADFKAVFENSIKEEKGWSENEWRILDKKKNEFWFESNSVPIFDSDQVLIAFRGTNHDLTARKKYENLIKIKSEELELSNRELEQFAYIASHDLQEPLRKIISFSKLITDSLKDQLDEESQDYLNRMSSAAERMRKLIEALLEFSQVGRKAVVSEEIDLNDIVKEVFSDLEVRIKESKAHITTSSLPKITGDRVQMHQLFLNLISNALKYTKENQPPRVSIHAEEEDAKVKITISDQGIGFDEKYKDKLFIPFSRLHTRQEYQGTGIGLSICKKIVEKHNGEISVKSILNMGTVFTIILPKVIKQ